VTQQNYTTRFFGIGFRLARLGAPSNIEEMAGNKAELMAVTLAELNRHWSLRLVFRGSATKPAVE